MLGKTWRDTVLGVLREWPDNEMRAQDIYDYLAADGHVMPTHVRAFSEVLCALTLQGLVVKHGRGSSGVWYAIAREP